MKTSFRILTIAFAITLFAAYMVYSQLQQNRSVAPSSKLMVLTEPRSDSTLTNLLLTRGPPPLASFSTDPAPTIEVVSNDYSDMVISGSKSAPAFVFRRPVLKPPPAAFSTQSVTAARSNTNRSTPLPKSSTNQTSKLKLKP
jgi:hypothetical protein